MKFKCDHYTTNCDKFECYHNGIHEMNEDCKNSDTCFHIHDDVICINVSSKKELNEYKIKLLLEKMGYIVK